MALFCDFENVALGVRDANYEKFDIKPVLERLLLKGSIVVKKAYCDWDRYKGFKATMHEANFELIEIPHVRQSGKNSADIRLVVDALDLCYTKSHVNTFVIISGDSDFSPLVSKLRENAKQVIGVGVKQSTSDLLVANCDEFIFYDDLVRESRRAAAKRDPRGAQPAIKRSPEEDTRRKEDLEGRKSEAIEMAVETFDALVSERGDSGKIWASMLKEAIKRRKPDFSESYYGFRTFGNLLEEAQTRGLLEFGRDEKSGAYVYRSHAAAAGRETGHEAGALAPAVINAAPALEAPAPAGERQESRRKGRGGRSKPAFGRDEKPGTPVYASSSSAAGDEAGPEPQVAPSMPVVLDVVAAPDASVELGVPATRHKGRGGRKPAFGRDEKPRASPYRSVVEEVAEVVPEAPPATPMVLAMVAEPAAPVKVDDKQEMRRKGRGAGQAAQKSAAEAMANLSHGLTPAASTGAPAQGAPEEVAEGVAKAVRKPAARSRRPRKTPMPDSGA